MRRDAFADALSLDRDNTTAARGLGFAYLKLEKPQKAADVLAKAAPNPPVDRTMTLAMSSSLIAKNNPMRAVKFLMEYLKSRDASADEPVINALGITLNRVVTKGDTSALKSPLFNDAVKVYSKLNDKLEAANPGKKRWGITGDNADDVNKKFKAYNEAMKKKERCLERAAKRQCPADRCQQRIAERGIRQLHEQRELIANAESHVRRRTRRGRLMRRVITTRFARRLRMCRARNIRRRFRWSRWICRWRPRPWLPPRQQRGGRR